MITREEWDGIETGDILILSKRRRGRGQKGMDFISREVLDGSYKSIMLKKLRGSGVSQYAFDKLHKRIIEIITK